MQVSYGVSKLHLQTSDKLAGCYHALLLASQSEASLNMSEVCQVVIPTCSADRRNPACLWSGSRCSSS